MQLSSVNSVYATDVNGDNKIDLISGGNNFNFPPQFGRLDASYGDVLINKGNGQFECIPQPATGISVSAEVKDIKLVKGHNKRFIIVTQNDQVPVLYQINK